MQMLMIIRARLLRSENSLMPAMSAWISLRISARWNSFVLAPCGKPAPQGQDQKFYPGSILQLHSLRFHSWQSWRHTRQSGAHAHQRLGAAQTIACRRQGCVWRRTALVPRSPGASRSCLGPVVVKRSSYVSFHNLRRKPIMSTGSDFVPAHMYGYLRPLFLKADLFGHPIHNPYVCKMFDVEFETSFLTARNEDMTESLQAWQFMHGNSFTNCLRLFGFAQSFSQCTTVLLFVYLILFSY